MTQPERMCAAKHLRNHLESIAASPVGLVMFMFADAIFVSMSKSHHRNDALDQQERVRHLWPYLPLESIHHRSGHLTLCRAYIIAMLRVHHYIVSPATLFRVLWRTHFKNRRISSHGSSSHHLWSLHQRVVRLSTSPWFILIVCDAFTNDSSVCLHLHGSSWRHLCCFFWLDICVWVCIILVYVRMYVYTWRSVIFTFFRMKTFHYVVILEDKENMDPSSGKNN
jgi:hypothetical protein